MNFQNASIVTAAEMRAIDRATTERFGVPSLTLMENAGGAVATHVLEHYASARKITVFCGKGNNGGDGFVAARHLHEQGRTVQVILLADPTDLRGDAASMYGKLPGPAIVAKTSEELQNDRVQQSLSADLYLDAILGTGFKPPVSGLYADAIALLNASKSPVVAVDIPSGADADAMHPQRVPEKALEQPPQQGMIARADSIITFTAPRPAHVFGQLTKGLTVVADIGSPEEAIAPSPLKLHVITPGFFAPILAPREVDSNKGLYGHVVVVGGSLGKAGAAAMAGMAALRVGAGLATVATPKSVLPTVAGFHPELMTEPVPETELGTMAQPAEDRIIELLKGITIPTVAIGPGISRTPETAALVRSLFTRLKNPPYPTVVDADGLNAFQGHIDELNGSERSVVITPHPGEMARLVGCTTADVQKDRLGIARKFAREHRLVVVLKGYRTIVTTGDEAWINVTGNPGMATGGTGDILTGMIAGLVAQFPGAVLFAVLAAVHLHGLAGDIARESKGEHSLVATDLLDALPEAFRRAKMAAQSRSVCWVG
jgi:ADP-dependent NAD(P)H-hydrate dehydratase / NAD(P)H-hydrate epimerase